MGGMTGRSEGERKGGGGEMRVARAARLEEEEVRQESAKFYP